MPRGVLRHIVAGTRAPALHFLVLGGLLFAASTRFSGSPVPARRDPIVITGARIAEIRDDYQRSLETDPTPAELAALIDREAEEQMLYHEALLLGLDRGDRTVEWRVVEKMRFLYGDAAGDNAVAYRRGLALGLARDDIMVRDTLVTKMRLLAKAASRNEEPEGIALDRALDQYFRDHRDTYAQPERVSVTHVFLSATRRGDSLEADAQSLRQQLQESHTPPEAAAHWGDPFVAGNTFRSASPSTLVKTFGEAFTDAALHLEPGRWSEPIRSPYGLHLVWLSDRQSVSVPAFEAVRSQVLRTFRAERHAQYLARMLTQLHQAYEVRVEKEDYASR
jgi:hypothetical protein